MKLTILGQDYYTTIEEYNSIDPSKRNKVLFLEDFSIITLSNLDIYLDGIYDYEISFNEDFGHVWKNKLVWKDNAEDYFKENIPLIEDYIVSKYNWLKEKMSELEHFKEEIERYNSLKEVI
jgi:hypothetical protein